MTYLAECIIGTVAFTKLFPTRAEAEAYLDGVEFMSDREGEVQTFDVVDIEETGRLSGGKE